MCISSNITDLYHLQEGAWLGRFCGLLLHGICGRLEIIVYSKKAYLICRKAIQDIKFFSWFWLKNLMGSFMQWHLNTKACIREAIHECWILLILEHFLWCLSLSCVLAFSCDGNLVIQLWLVCSSTCKEHHLRGRGYWNLFCSGLSLHLLLLYLMQSRETLLELLLVLHSSIYYLFVALYRIGRVVIIYLHLFHVNMC